MQHRSSKSIRIAILPGDGIGPEVINATIPVLDAVQETVEGLKLEYVFGEAGLDCIPKYGTNLPEKTIEDLKSADCCLKGPITTPEEPGSPRSVVVKIRTMFDLYVNLRPLKSLPNVPSLKANIDMTIVRENTEGLYSGVEFMSGKDSAVALRIITRKGCERIARFAFNLSMKRKKHLTYIHKGNILKITDGIFKDSILEVAKEFPEVKIDEMRVDVAAMQLIKRPDFFDVIVTPNLYGDILSDEGAQLVGGLGVAPGANIGKNYAMFEPIHGSAPDIAGRGIANPLATILASKLMFEWLGFKNVANKIESGVEKVLRDGRKLTVDIALPKVNPVKCSEMGREVAKHILKG
ncbi:MAG: isocitrate/isopropylmalate dehydrogenase family protein [Candidatus Hermodarchaeota archaeon]